MSSDSTVSVGSFTGTFRRVNLPMGLIVDELKVSTSEATIGVKPFNLDLTKPGVLEANVAALDLAEFLNQKAPGGLRDFAIAIRDGKVLVEATARVIVEMRAKVTCTLRIHEGKQLFVDLESVDVLGFGGAKGMVQGQLDQINPVLDAGELPIEVTLTDVKADHDRITLTGLVHGVTA